MRLAPSGSLAHALTAIGLPLAVRRVESERAPGPSERNPRQQLGFRTNMSARRGWGRQIFFVSYVIPFLSGAQFVVELRHVDREATMGNELNRDVTRRTGHVDECGIRSLGPSLRTDNDVVITVVNWDGKPVENPVHAGVRGPEPACRTLGR